LLFNLPSPGVTLGWAKTHKKRSLDDTGVDGTPTLVLNVSNTTEISKQ